MKTFEIPEVEVLSFVITNDADTDTSFVPGENELPIG
jgi:hypothetical protein